MTDKEAARQQIAALVEKFRATPKASRDAYNEDETRHFFILPLFRALGWETDNPADMSAEEQISRGFVDFGFYLNGVPAFYLETKRIREDLDRPDYIRQAINYAYLKGVTWSVLTDFEGLHIYNAEWETNVPAQARYLTLSWEEYAGGDFEDLWLLSKPAMRERLLDKRATRHGKKARRVPVTELLFKNMTAWRRDLFSHMRHMSGQLWSNDAHAIDNAVQRLLDRLIFLRTAEDRGLEPPRLKELVRQNDRTPAKIWPGLLALFREMDAIYNSNLFAQAPLDLIDLHDPDLIRGIINDLYKYGGVEFDFNAITADVLGAVYEQYLGFRAQDLENPAGIKELKGKQEKRKKQGIYYTPQYIVRYIVQQTVGRLLQDGADPHALRILDPACGSGSFLIEAFDVLDRWLATHEPNVPSALRRRRILTENLYGVDLDDQAVEVTRLNLLLRATFERGKLPLLTHIQRGNSLIDDPTVAGETAFNWEKAFPEVFHEETRPLWFATFVTHNSRVSERMVTYGVQAGEPLIFTPEEQVVIATHIAEACRRHGIAVCALNVLPDHVHMVLAARDEAELTEHVRKINGYSAHAFNSGLKPAAVPPGAESGSGLKPAVAPLGAESGSGLKPAVAPLGAESGSGLKPAVAPPGAESGSGLKPAVPVEGRTVWARKFHAEPIRTQEQLEAVLYYIRNNHHKHAERWGEALLDTWGKGLKPLVEALCVTPEEATNVAGGFDVIIGNPPYVRQETLGAAFKEYAEAHYETYAGTADLYVYFIERSLTMLREGGRYGIIVANKWLRAGYGKPLRRWLKMQAIEEIIDFGDLPVFQDAITYPCILLARPNKGLKPLVPTADFHAVKVDTLDFAGLDAYAAEHRYPVRRAALDDAGWSLAPHDAQALLDKLRASGIPLGDYVGGAIYYGIKTGLNEAFIISEQVRTELVRRDPRSADLIKPFLLGRDVKRYETPQVDKYLILIPSGWTDEQMRAALPRSGLQPAADLINGGNGLKPAADLISEGNGLKPAADLISEGNGLKPAADLISEGNGLKPAVDSLDAWGWLKQQYPAIAGYLAPFEQAAAARWDKGDYWWELRPCVYYTEFEKPKILYPDIAPRGTFTLDYDSGLYGGNTLYFIASDSRYLLALLNSALITFVCVREFSNYRGGYIRFFQDYVEKLPIRTINPDDRADVARHDQIVALVEEMIALKQQIVAPEMSYNDERFTIAKRIEDVDRAIDALVYELYGLTTEEIALVEAATAG